jgi:lipoprotein-releasing system permease protein
LRVDTGQSIVLNFLINEQSVKRKMHITGIYNTGLGEYDRKFALIDKMLLQQILQKDSTEVTGIEVFCNDILQADKINDYLYEEILPSNWYSETIRSKYPNIFEWLALQDVTKYFILLLILAVCIINMSTTTMILIFERTHMVGVLTVLGMTRWTQQKIFLRYASRILLSSIVIGNLIGYGLCFIQNKYKLLKLSESDYYLSYVPIDMSVMPVIILNILFFTLILLFLFLPTIIVQSIQPVKALKFR